MREIEFRGYSKLNNMWYYGLLGKFDNKYYIECKGGTKPFVEEDSIGQYTGFKDKNGKKIYEGDIVNVYTKDGGKIKFDEHWLITFYEGAFQRTNQIGIFYNMSEICDFMWYEVVGNIYEEHKKGEQ